MPVDSELLESLKTEFNRHISFRKKRAGIVQVIAPLFHEDGDMVDVFIDLPSASPEGRFRISDHGMTLMRLSYSYEVDTDTKRKILARILSENGVTESEGRLYLDTTPETIYPDLLQFSQTVAKVSSMQMFKREVIQSLFYDTLNDFVASSLTVYKPMQHYVPLASQDAFDVDWRFPAPMKDIFLWGVKDVSKARLAVLSCLQFRQERVQFRSVVIHEDFENGLSRKDRARVTTVVDKQFVSLADFKTDAEEYFEREIPGASTAVN